MNTKLEKLEKLKAMLRESIALAEDPNLSPEPWMGGPVDSIGGGTLYDPTVGIANFMWDNECDRTPIRRFRTKAQCDANLAFTTHARTFHPMFSKMLLATIVAIEKQACLTAYYNGHPDGYKPHPNGGLCWENYLCPEAKQALCRDLQEDGE